MSGRVNVKFVVILTVVLIGVAGAAIYGAATIILKSGEDHANNARQAQADGDLVKAQEYWGMAVNEEPTNLEYLNEYLNAVQHKPTSTQLQYETQFRKYLAALGSIATTMKTDLAAHERYFDENLLLMTSGAPNRASFESLIEEVNRLENLLYTEIQADPENELWSNLRRYRGESVAIISQIATDLEAEFLDNGIADLEAAQAVRPGDVKILRSLNAIYAAKASRARLSGRQSEADDATNQARAAIQSFIAANPDDIEAKYILLGSEIAEGLRDVDKLELFGPDLTRAKRQMHTRFTDRANEIANQTLEADLTGFDVRSLSQITYVLASIIPEQAQDILADIWAKASEQNEDDRRLHFAYGMFLKRLGQYERAIDVIEYIADLPNVPVTSEGYLRFSDRNQALYQMADAAMEKWNQLASQPQSQPEWLAKVREYRSRLANEIADDHPMMLHIDARLAMADGNMNTADKLLREFNAATNDTNVSGQKLAAEVANKLGNPGLERDLLERARELDPEDVRTLIRLANVYTNEFRDYERAERLLTAAYDRRPDLDAINNQIQIVRAMLNSDNSDDPVLKILAQAQRAQDSGSTNVASQLIRDGIAEHPDDIRMITSFAQLLIDQEEWEEARQVISDGLVKSPGNSRLEALQAVADIAGDLNKIIDVVSEQDIPEIEKQLRLYRLYTQNEDEVSAAAALDAAEAIDPTHKQVVIFRFDEAIRARDAAEARRIYEANKDRDIDGADGLALRARVELAEGDKESARRTLQSAVDLGSVNATTLRLLADVLMDMGDTFNALERYREAIAIRPTDLDLLKGYISVLSRLGRNEEALDTARSALGIAERDEQFRELWLLLEGRVGDKQLAYDRRIEIAKNNPNDLRNSTLLIGLSLDLRLFDEARQRIDEARAEQDSLMLASLDARWHADKGDLTTASQVFSDFIASEANDVNNPQAYLTFGRFLMDRGSVSQGLTTIRQARLVQDPENPVADAVLADELFKIDQFEQAIPVLKNLIAADFQASLARSRLVECYTRLRMPAEAQEMIDTFSTEEQSTLNMMLLRSDVANLQGNELESESLVDKAIAEYPNDPLPYMKRAAKLMANPNRMADAVEDLTRAIELDPSNSNAFRLRSIAYSAMERKSDAAKDIAASAEAAPDNIQLRLGAIQRLIQLERIEMASDLVDRALVRRPTDISLMISAGDIFTGAGEHRTALRYYERAWEQSKTIPVGRRLVACLLDQPRPDVRRATQIAQNQNMTDEEDPTIYIIRARIAGASNDRNGITANLSLAYELIKENPQRLAAWTRNVITLLESEEAAVSYMAALDADRSLSPWASLFYAETMLRIEGRETEAISKITSLINSAQNAPLVHMALKVRAMHSYGEGDYQNAADDMKKALEIAPADPELHNNLAYTLALHLNKAADAITHAKRAIEIDPNMRAAYDTLGLAHLKAGNTQESIDALEQALSLSQSDADRAPVLVHLAMARFESGNTGGAQESAQEARSIILGDTEAFSDEIQDELEQILDKIRTQ